MLLNNYRKLTNFYRAMHFSAKRGIIAIACRLPVRLSVCPSETLVDQEHIGWKSWKLITRTISPTFSLFGAQRPSTNCEGTWGNLRETRGGVGKMVCWSTKAAISPKRVQTEEKLLWGPIGTHQRSFQRHHPLPPTASTSPRLGFAPHPKLQSLLSQELVKLRTSHLATTITGSIRSKGRGKFWRKSIVGVSRDCTIFGYPLLSQEREKLQISNLASISVRYLIGSHGYTDLIRIIRNN